MEKSHRAFTLIELSIVLVIIGLIVGGVLVGSALIAASKARATISQIDNLNTAAAAFREKYSCIPGDCSNATSYLGTSANCGNIQGGANPGVLWWSLADGTCNGSGNWLIEGDQSGINIGEPTFFFDHLQKAGLLKGSLFAGPYPKYDGTGTRTEAYATLVSEGLGNQIALQPVITYWQTWSIMQNRSYFAIGLVNVNIGVPSTMLTGLVSPKEAYAIDAKVDDGIPNLGRVVAVQNNAASGESDCFSSVFWSPLSFTSPVTYNMGMVKALQGYPAGCRLMFQTAF